MDQTPLRWISPSSQPRRPRRTPTALVAVVGMTLLLGGCQAKPPTTTLADPAIKARELNTQGIAAKDPAEAKKLFAAAVAADPLYGPAQNNFGIACLQEGDYFHAAQAFDQAIKLMPQDPEPRTNLGLVFEAAGQYRNAQKQLEAVLVIAPEHMPAIQALARVRVRIGTVDEVILGYLRAVALRGTDETWRNWAKRELLKRNAERE